LRQIIFNQKIEVAGKDGKIIAAIHGIANDIELKPGSIVEMVILSSDQRQKIIAILS